MTGDRLARPRIGVAGGVPYVALPPTAVGADVDGPVPLLIGWHGFDPPRSEFACAAALPLTGVAAWRVYLRLPVGDPAGGDYLLDLLGPAAERAAAALPGAVAELHTSLATDCGSIGLLGIAEGGTAALLAIASGNVPVAAAALVSPVAVPVRAIAAYERRYLTTYHWTDAAHEIADRLDFTLRAPELARIDPPLLLLSGQDDEIVRPADVALIRDALSACGADHVRMANLSAGHALAAEPGTEPCPPTAEAVGVDAALTDWFRHRVRPLTDATRPDLRR